MFPTRAVGHVRAPGPERLAALAARHHLDPTPEHAALLAGLIAGSCEAANRLDDLDEPAVALRHTDRDPGRSPVAGEDPFNAFIRYCSVRGADEGPLAGRTLAVKDCIAVAGVPMTNGGRRTPVLVPTEDAVVVERLLDAGATVVGKTNLEDLAAGLGEASFFGAARNPVDPRFSTGGSSSGSGAAVASGAVDLALGADEAGSVRIPAAWCGIVGMKATHGLVPSYGMSYMDHTIDHIGPMTATVVDNARMLSVMAGPDWRDPQWVRGDFGGVDYTTELDRGIEGMTIGVLTESLEPVGCSDDVLEAFNRAQKTLAELGARIVPVSVPLWPDAFTIENSVLGPALAAMHHSYGQGYGHLGRIDEAAMAAAAAQTTMGADDLPTFTQAMLITADWLREQYHLRYYAKAQNLRLELRRQVETALAGVDVLITPTTPTVAFELLDRRASPAEMAERMGETIGAVANTCALDLTGHPALTVPAGPGAHGLPVGLQLVGPRFGESVLYRVGAAFEAA